MILNALIFVGCSKNNDAVENGNDDEVKVSVIKLNNTTLSLIPGETGQLIATILPENATNKTIKWSSSNSTVATVNEMGIITAVSEGTTTVTGSVDGKSAACIVTVSTSIIPVTEIMLNKSSTNLIVGGTDYLTVFILPNNATNKNVNWLSSAPEIVYVDTNGKITALKEGSATITACSADGQKTATCIVYVTNIAVTGITLNKTALTLLQGDSETLTATVTPYNATNKTITWSSSNDYVAQIEDGKVTGLHEGTAVITASADNGNKTATCIVTVKSKAAITMKTSGQLSEVTFRLQFEKYDEGESSTVLIDWGDGNYKEYPAYDQTFTNSSSSSKAPTISIITNNCYITHINCSRDKLTYLDISNCTELIDLACDDNQLTSLDVSKNTKLSTFSCALNDLTSLELSNNTELIALGCSNNSISSLIVPSSKLEQLLCHHNKITNLTLKSTEVMVIDCEFNRMSSSALNQLFISLPDRTPTRPQDKLGYIYIKGNNGTDLCDISIANRKSWNTIK